MSDDLISRKILSDELASLRISLTNISCIQKAVDETIKSVLRIVNEQPVAFDKEKVVNELMIRTTISEERMEFYAEKGFTQNESLADGKARAYRSAIEIVEKGGIKRETAITLTAMAAPVLWQQETDTYRSAVGSASTLMATWGHSQPGKEI